MVEGGDLHGDEAHGVVDCVETHGVGDPGVVDGICLLYTSDAADE